MAHRFDVVAIRVEDEGAVVVVVVVRAQAGSAVVTRAGSERRDSATSAPNSTRMRTQSSIEPSWFPQVEVSL